MEADREGIGRDGGVKAPLRILVSAGTARRLAPAIAQACGGHPHQLVLADDAPADFDAAFVSRDVTGRSTKHELQPHTQRFHDLLRGAASLRWVHIHSAGADRPVYGEIRARGVQVATSSGSNAGVVAETALAGVLALTRRLPLLLAAQRERRWAPLLGDAMPRDLEGQRAVLVGWGPIGQRIGAVLALLGMRVTVVRHTGVSAGPGFSTVGFDGFLHALVGADWLLLAGPLTPQTRGLVDERALAQLAPGACVVNVSRGEVVHEVALIEALQAGRLGGAFLDVFAHEPLPAESPLWTLDNVIATPHSAGFSSGNEAKVDRLFLDNLGRWLAGRPLNNLSGETA